MLSESFTVASSLFMRTLRDKFRKEDVFLYVGFFKAQGLFEMQDRINSISNTSSVGGGWRGKRVLFHHEL